MPAVEPTRAHPRWLLSILATFALVATTVLALPGAPARADTVSCVLPTRIQADGLNGHSTTQPPGQPLSLVLVDGSGTRVSFGGECGSSSSSDYSVFTVSWSAPVGEQGSPLAVSSDVPATVKYSANVNITRYTYNVGGDPCGPFGPFTCGGGYVEAGSSSLPYSLTITYRDTAPLVAAFSAPSAVPLGTPVVVDGNASSTDPDSALTGWSWDFGDGAHATTPSTSHLYTTSGTYTITENVADSLGRTAAVSHSVTVQDPPSGGGTPQPPSGTAPVASWTGGSAPVAGTPVAFDGSGSSDGDGDVTAYAWTFGDGSSGTGLTPRHSYAEPGIYPVTLTVTDDSGLTGHLTRTVTVADAPPVAAFTVAPAVPVAGGTVSFDGTGSHDVDGTVDQYVWDFGDGTSGTGASPSHIYGHKGSYDVVLTVTDDAGSTDDVTHTVTVGGAAPTAGMVVPTDAVAGTSAVLDGAPSSDPDGSISGYSWAFGDGQSGTGQTPSHTFAHAGSYLVALTVTDDDGLQGTTSRMLTVAEAAPAAAFTAPPATAGRAATFDGTPSWDPDGTVTGYHWDFGDGTTADGATPPHTYGTAGSYPVTLTVTDGSGLTGTVTHLATVTPAVVATPGYPATDLGVSVSGKAPTAGRYTYTVTVKNLGHAAAHDVVLLDTPDSAQTLVAVSAPSALHCSGVPVGATGTITCKSGTATLAAGKTWVVTVTVRQPAALRTVRTLVDAAQVRAANPDGVAKNNAARLSTTLAAAR